MSGSAEATKKHIADYKKVAATLGVMTIVTVLVSYLDVAVPVAIVIDVPSRPARPVRPIRCT